MYYTRLCSGLPKWEFSYSCTQLDDHLIFYYSNDSSTFVDSNQTVKWVNSDYLPPEFFGKVSSDMFTIHGFDVGTPSDDVDFSFEQVDFVRVLMGHNK
jgi:hypothetical protein